MKRYRVWTKNCDNTVTVMNEWTTYGKCKQLIIGRWGHWPPFAFISQAKFSVTFRRANG